MTIKLAADVLAKVAAADAIDRQNAFDVAFLKTASDELGLSPEQAIALRTKFAEASQAALKAAGK